MPAVESAFRISLSSGTAILGSASAARPEPGRGRRNRSSVALDQGGTRRNGEAAEGKAPGSPERSAFQAPYPKRRRPHGQL